MGNYLEARYGRRGDVFIDDRFDMYPADVVDDYARALRGEPAGGRSSTDHETDVVLWARDCRSTELLTAGPDWQSAYDDQTWVVDLPLISAGLPR